jgi:hypothetical protein
MSEKTVSLILAFLHTKKSKIFSNIQTSRHDGYLPYVSITFCYTGLDVDVCVYNETFIKLKVNDQAWTICDGIISFRDSIYKLDYFNYGYRYAG